MLRQGNSSKLSVGGGDGGGGAAQEQAIEQRT